MSRKGIELTLKVRLDCAWDGPVAALFGTPQNWGEDFCERVKDRLEVDEAELVGEVKLVE